MGQNWPGCGMVPGTLDANPGLNLLQTNRCCCESKSAVIGKPGSKTEIPVEVIAPEIRVGCPPTEDVVIIWRIERARALLTGERGQARVLISKAGGLSVSNADDRAAFR